MTTQSGAFDATASARKARPIMVEACRTALKGFKWCAQQRRIYAHAWRNTMAAMSVYEGMTRQPGGGKVQTEAGRKALSEITRNY